MQDGASVLRSALKTERDASSKPVYNVPMPTFDTTTASEPAPQSGVDRSLLIWMGSKTPKERLEILQRNVNAFLKARNGRRKN